MQIYNITQEKVSELVNKAFDSDDRPKELCLCYQCRLDVICYVLNRAKPVYVLSERGIAHLKDNYSNSLQELADLTRLIENGIKLVSQAKREHHLDPLDSDVPKAAAYFNFPTITGSVLSGVTFAPVDANVTLILDDKLVEMKDSRWSNPLKLNAKSNENYLYWPKAITSDKVGEERTFIFQLKIEAEGYEPSSHIFELDLVAEEEFNNNFQAHNTHTCNNVLLFKEE